MKSKAREAALGLIIAAQLLWIRPVSAWPYFSDRPYEAESDVQVEVGAGTNDHAVVVRSFQRTRLERKQVSWLGVGVSEASDNLVAQLGLKPGQGLVITVVAGNSPAEKAALRRRDVLVSFDDQMLLDAEQLRKLVQMHKEGDSVTLTYFRDGKKETVTAKLGRAMWSEAADDMDDSDGLRAVRLNLTGLENLKPEIDQQMRRAGEVLHEEKAVLTQLKTEMSTQGEAEIRRALEETRRALERAVKDRQLSMSDYDSAAREMDEMATNRLDVANGATVVVQKDLPSARSIVQTDETGDYTIIADPKRRLTVHNHAGKLLFDGEIETAAEQARVPKDLWEKVRPMLDQLGTVPPSQAAGAGDKKNP